MNFFEWLTKKAIPWYTSLGFTSRTVTLEVTGRKSGKPNKVSLSKTICDGCEYFVSLAGEVNWVKNVRAADGRAVMIHRKRIPIQLTEIPEADRAPVLLAYVHSRAFTHSGPEASRLFFGLGPNPTLDEMKAIANKYVVFHVTRSNA